MIKTTPLNDRFGVEVHDADIAEFATAERFPALRRLFDEHSALLFRGTGLDHDTHLRLAALFGPIEDRNIDERKPGEEFQIPEVSNILDDGSVSEEMDLHTLQLKANFQWHCDSTFMPVPRVGEHHHRQCRAVEGRCDRAGVDAIRLGRYATKPEGKD